MFKAHQKTTIMLFMIIYTATAAGLARGAKESFKLFLRENESARVRYENCSPEQRLEMKQRWEIFNERYNSLSLAEQKKLMPCAGSARQGGAGFLSMKRQSCLTSGNLTWKPVLLNIPSRMQYIT